MGSTKIEWASRSWNPVTGCTKISEGCKNCYAERMAKRLTGRYGYPKDEPFRVTFHPDRLDQPFKWKKPRRIFVCSMSDLFHKDIPTRYIQSVLDVIKKCPQHTFLILTKRIEEFWNQRAYFLQGPLPENMWLGVTIEHPKYGYRADYLRKIPAAVRFLSLEPLLADFSEYPGVLDDMNWCIVGGESGPGARPMHPDWVRSVRDQCVEAGVPFFFKQWGEFIGVDYILDNDFLEAGGIWECSDGRQHDEIKKRPQGDDRWIKVGKKAAGRLLDGREHNEYPTPGQ